MGFILSKASPRKQELVWSEVFSSKQPMPGAAHKSLEAADPTDPSVCVSVFGDFGISPSPMLLYTNASFFFFFIFL